MKNKIKNEYILSINNWDFYKKKVKFKKNTKKIEKIFFYKFNTTILKSVIKNGIKLWKNLHYSGEIKFNFSKLINNFLKINIKRVKNYKISHFEKNNIVYIILDIRRLKSNIVIFKKSSCLSTITNGIIFKKMQFKNKKYKKSEKLTYLALKTILVKLNFLKNYKNITINIKGIKGNVINIIQFINKNLKNNYNQITYINSMKIGNNKYFKFKKIKAIKRRLKKKIIKLK